MYNPRVLGIDPGARQIGISVFYGNDLIFYRVKTIKQQNLDETLKRLRVVLGKLVRAYKIDCIALGKVVFVQQHRSAVKTVYDEIKAFIQRENIGVLEYDPALVRRYICEKEPPTRQKVSQILAQKHRELSKYLSVSRSWQEAYFAKLFNAVALGFVCVRKLSNSIRNE